MLFITLTNSLLRNRLQFLPRAVAVGKRTLFSAQRSVQVVSMGIKSDITLYTASTPTGIKVPILLEELGIDHKVRKYYPL